MAGYRNVVVRDNVTGHVLIEHARARVEQVDTVYVSGGVALEIEGVVLNPGESYLISDGNLLNLFARYQGESDGRHRFQTGAGRM